MRVIGIVLPLAKSRGNSAKAFDPLAGATARISCSRIRPPRPVPETFDQSTPNSFATRRARGVIAMWREEGEEGVDSRE